MFTKNFTQLNRNDADIAGGKGASLGEMIQSGIPVPEGFVVLAGTFEKFLEETDLNVEVDAILHTVDHNAMHTVEDASEKIQALIKAAQMPSDIAQEIEKEFVKLDAEFVAVRSSATAEDGTENAWAGQLDSYLNTTEDNLLEKVQHCWASLFTPRAIFYRFEKNLHKQKISVAVVVQKMVASEISGIAFSVHPVTEDYNQLIIEAGFGLGEAIVSGSITPDSYVVEKESRNILDINVSTQTRGLYRAQNGGNEWRDVPEPQASSQVLTQEQILELSEIILGIEKHYGFPCDIEWAYENSKFYIVQSRPITTLQKKQETSEENIVEFVNKNKFHKQFVYSFLPTVSKTFLPIFTFEATTNCYLNNPLVGRLRLKKLPKFVITLKDGYEDWEGGDMQKITRDTDIKFIIQECRTIMEKHSQFTEELLQKDYSKIDNIELAEILRKSNEVMKEICQRQIFLIRDFIETENSAYIKILPELRVEITNFVDKFYISCNDILTSLADRFEQIPWRTFMYATTGEIIELLQGSKATDEFAKIYQRHIAFVFDGEKISFITDSSIVSKVDEILHKKESGKQVEITSNQFYGNSAFGGHAKGNVVKITDAQYRDIAKYLEDKKDYILVISMTRPEFIPYLKNCKAIITDEGGITCHAAIVSRELKIPCIISTKIATQVLHDGDLVEVDADKGIVRILNRKKLT
jgi:phosphoenolpyruvate synthase/pyruvate phosphate dikinase